MLCRYYKTQQTGYEWKESGAIDPKALAVLKEDSQRQVRDQVALDVLAVHREGLSETLK
jgi:hypothetical protein